MACNPRDHLIDSPALGTSLRLAEIVGLDVGDVYTPERRPRSRLRIHPAIAKGGRTGDVLLMKGPSACEKFLLRKGPLETALLGVVRGRLVKLLGGGGERILRKHIEEELQAQGQDRRREMDQIRTRLEEIDRKADVLLEGMSPEAQAFVDNKLRVLASERRGLQSRLEALSAIPCKPVDVEAVLRQGTASLHPKHPQPEGGLLAGLKAA